MSEIHNKTNRSTHWRNVKVLLFIIFLIPAISCFCQESENLILTPDQSVLSAGIQSWLNLIPNEHLIDYGFTNRNEFTKVNIGKPLYIYTLPEDSIVELQGNEKIKFEFKNEWFLPLYIDNRICCFLSIKKENGKQKIVGIGANFLAIDLNDEEEQFSNNEEIKGILDIPSIGAKFLVKGKKDLSFYPLGVTKCKFRTTENKFLKKKEMFDITYSLLNNR